MDGGFDVSTVTVGQFAALTPAAIRVFQRRNIDYCCGGGRSFIDACLELGVHPVEVLNEIVAAKAEAAAQDENWGAKSNAELIDELLSKHHQPLHRELPRLSALMAAVLEAHGAAQPSLAEIAKAFQALREDLEPHLREEEAELFPAILEGRPLPGTGTIDRMRVEHRRTGELLEHLRELTDHHHAPAGASDTLSALYQGFQDVELGLQEHMHLENNMLFPRLAASGG